MTPDELRLTCIELFGKRGWQIGLARCLKKDDEKHVNVRTVRRWCKDDATVPFWVAELLKDELARRMVSDTRDPRHDPPVVSDTRWFQTPVVSDTRDPRHDPRETTRLKVAPCGWSFSMGGFQTPTIHHDPTHDPPRLSDTQAFRHPRSTTIPPTIPPAFRHPRSTTIPPTIPPGFQTAKFLGLSDGQVSREAGLSDTHDPPRSYPRSPQAFRHPRSTTILPTIPPGFQTPTIHHDPTHHPPRLSDSQVSRAFRGFQTPTIHHDPTHHPPRPSDTHDPPRSHPPSPQAFRQPSFSGFQTAKFLVRPGG